MKMELLAPAGDLEKLKTALYFGADACYVGGKALSLRALAGNFTDEELIEGVNFAHSLNKKVYVTVNIFAKNSDLKKAEEYFKFLESIKVDGVIVSDTGLVSLALSVTKTLDVHLSTQANTLNKMTVKFWRDMGVKRVVLARELSAKEIKEIHDFVPEMELECFVHGAMCISYSGRCLLSNYLTGRDSNRGECVQACRWEYEIREVNKDGGYLTLTEDERGSYIMNSKDLNLIDYLDVFSEAGVCSLKIEGRMKSAYYLATVINAYRRAIDDFEKVGKGYKDNPLYNEELLKTAHRDFTTAYFLKKNDKTVNYEDSQSKGTHKFIATVVEELKDGYALIEMRNRFKVGDVLEVLSPNETFNQKLTVEKMTDEKDNLVLDAKAVQQKLKLYTSVQLKKGDILRIKV